MKISLIIATYNNPEALSLVLKSILNQVLLPDEVVIADDGSTDETKLLIETFKGEFPIPLLHVWHENKGFRAAAIRNMAINKSSGDYLIFSDGDLFFHPHFINDFKNNIKRGEALIGSRVFLKKPASEKRMTNQNSQPVFSFFSNEIEANRLNSVRITLLSKLFKQLRYSSALRGGLLGVCRDDILKVNGWNEEFEGWGFEDTELVARLFNLGVIFRKIKFQAITYHLWHKTQSRESADKNQELLKKTIQKNTIRCRKGITQR